jgi:hypothetical protein
MNGRMLFDPIGYPSRDVAPAALRASTVQLFQFLESARDSRCKTRRHADRKSRGVLLHLAGEFS